MINKQLLDASKREVIQSGQKINSEQKQRQIIIKKAKILGCESEVIKIMERTDRLMRQCPDPEERQQIAIMGINELHNLGLLNTDGSLNVNGLEIIPSNK